MYGLIFNVTVKNNGTQDVDMSWEETPLTIYKTKFAGDDIVGKETLNPYLYRRLKTNNAEDGIATKNLLLLVGSQKTLSFFVEVEPLELYYITFEASVDKNLKDKLTEQGKTGVWLTSKYHFVSDVN